MANDDDWENEITKSLHLTLSLLISLFTRITQRYARKFDLLMI